MKLRTLDGVDVAGKIVLLRLDLNLPMKDGVILDQTRLKLSLKTLQELHSKGAKVVIMSHLGRPKGREDPVLSLEPIAQALETSLQEPIIFQKEWDHRPHASITLLDNIRFHRGEEENDMLFAAEIAKLGDLYVNDAFSVSHRAHASVEAITHILPSYAGRLMEDEISALTKILDHPEHPVTAIVAGSKISTKLTVLENLLDRIDTLIVGGGIANTFLKAMGLPIGASIFERDMLDETHSILEKAKTLNKTIFVPRDANLDPGSRIAEIAAIESSDKIFDMGPESVVDIRKILEASKTVIWNGPVGVFEIPPYDESSLEIARIIAVLTQKGALYSVAGGGETIACLNKAGVMDKFSHVSTAGGAFLEWLEGKKLPGVERLSTDVSR